MLKRLSTNNFCHAPTSLFLTGNIKMDGMPTKITLFLYCIRYTATRSFISCCFILAFTSADIIFHKFLELHSTLSEKNIFVTIFHFLTDSLKPPNSLTAKIC